MSSPFPVALAGTAAPTLMWAHEHEVEPQALQQLRNIASLPWVEGLRVMPDVHLGKGATVGSVIAMRDAVSPNAVGVDIGCGMIGVRTSLTAADLPDDLHAIRTRIEQAVPVGFHAHDEPVDLRRLRPVNGSAGRERLKGADAFWDRFGGLHRTVQQLEARARKQLGTLGGGNHFIELCLDESDQVWLQLHSGSRNIGKELAERHVAIAKTLEHNQRIVDRELAVFLAGTPQMDAYLNDLWWAQEYAARSRAVMMALVVQAVRDSFPEREITFDEGVNCFAGETRVLTGAGIFPIAELAGGIHELLTTGGRWVKAPIMSFGKQRVYEVTVGRYGEEKVIRATGNHRWLLRAKVAHARDEATTQDLRVGDRLAYAFPARVSGMKVDRASVARGFVFGDGSLCGKQTRARAIFCGDKDESLLPYFEGLTTNCVRDYGSVKVLNGFPAEWKTAPVATSSHPDIVYGWLAGYFAADGDVDKSGRPSLSSSRRDHLEAVKALATSIGVGTYGIRTRVRRGIDGRDSELHVMGFMRSDLDLDFFVQDEHRARFATGRGAVERKGWTVRSVEITDDVEEVYCAVVPETEAFTLEDNILTRNCHHNYVKTEQIDGAELIVTRKGAIRAGSGEMGLIPGSMGTGSYVVRGLGNPASFQSASHGAGRRMSRTAAKKRFTVEDLAAQTAGVECRKDAGVVDEIPGAYKDLESVIAAQTDLVEVVARLRTIVCVKG
ncbi:hypothetical protein CCE01nite_39800 [Cellulomonas cellasea]|nr:hypothetical protein CCE01nite_39800 [Cellulomonas cellasea]